MSQRTDSIDSHLPEELEPEVHPTLDKLKQLQQEHDEIETEFKREINELNKKYRVKYDPLYKKRYDAMKEGEALPDFWLTAMKNHRMLNDMIAEADEPVLKYLEDIRCAWKEVETTAVTNACAPAGTDATAAAAAATAPKDQSSPGFSLHFVFKDENPYFTPNELVKTYYLEESSDLTDPVLSNIESTPIVWKPGKDITKKKVTKNQKNKRTKQVRKTTEMVSVDSFFNFFSSHSIPTEEQLDEMGEEMVDELETEIEADYLAGTIFRDKIIPRAVDWYTGEAEDSDAETDDEEDDDSDEDSDEDDDEDSDEEESKGKDKSPKKNIIKGADGKPQDENCKQQ